MDPRGTAHSVLQTIATHFPIEYGCMHREKKTSILRRVLPNFLHCLSTSLHWIMTVLSWLSTTEGPSGLSSVHGGYYAVLLCKLHPPSVSIDGHDSRA